MCKSGQPHRWEARVYNRSGDRTSSPRISGKIVFLCNDLAHNYPELAKEWDWEANGSRTPQTGSLEVWLLWQQMDFDHIRQNPAQKSMNSMRAPSTPPSQAAAPEHECLSPASAG